MPEVPFIPDNYLSRLSRKLSSFGRSEALDDVNDQFGDPVFVAQNYIQPHCQLENPADGGDEGDVDRRPVFTTVNEFLGSGEKDWCEGHNCMFLLGDAGTGKTALLVLLKLAHLTRLWPSHFHCELLKLGASTLGKISDVKSPRKTILLLDALNEDPRAQADVFGRLSEILLATKEFHRVILSCRTAYFPDGRLDAFSRVAKFASGGHDCPTIFLSLFNNTQMDKYLKRRFRRMEEPARKRAKSILNEIGAFKARPLLLSHVDDFVHSRCKVWNAFSTFEVLVDAWFEREQRRIRSTDSRAKFSKETLLEACIKMARLMQLSESRRCVSKSELSEPLQEPELGHVEALDCRGRSFLRRDSGGAYRFTHATIQEFLIALGVKSGVLHSGKKRMPATELIISFLVHCDDARAEWRALDLTLASLAGAQLRGADLSRSLLVSADLARCVFNNASFDNGDLTSCEANGAKFSGCSFEFTKVGNALLRAAAFSGSQFSNASFAGSDLSHATFDGCKFDHTGLADSNLSDTVFAQSTISECSLKSSRLCGMELRDCSLANVKLDRCSLAGAKFRNTSLQDVSIHSADMRETELDTTFLNAVKAGAIKNWKTAAWDAAVATVLKLPPKENDKNAEAIESDLDR